MNEEWTVIYYPYIFRGKTLSSAVVWLPLIPWLPDFSIVITLWAIAYQEFSKWVCWKLDHRLSDWKADVSRSDSLTLKSAYLKDTGMTAKVFFFFFPHRKNLFAPFHAFITHLCGGGRNAVISILSFPFSLFRGTTGRWDWEQNTA